MYMELFDVSQIEGFDWDAGNIGKNEKKHGVTWKECEEAFLQKVYINDDIKHSKYEKRYYILTESKERKLFISFTLRDNKIRVISARNQNMKEKKTYINFIKFYEKQH